MAGNKSPFQYKAIQSMTCYHKCYKTEITRSLITNKHANYIWPRSNKYSVGR